MSFRLEPKSWRTHVTELPWRDPPTFPTFSNWEKEFIFLRKLNKRWVFCRTVYMRRRLGFQFYVKDYALDDFELIKKEADDKHVGS